MNRLSLASLVTVLAVPWLPACAQAECASDFDCGIGNSCDVGGVCITGDAGGRGGERMELVAPMPFVDSAYTSLPGGAGFDGNIGSSTNTGRADLSVWLHPEGQAQVMVNLPDQPSTFISVVVADVSVFDQPGPLVIASPTDTALSDSWAQACNYDAEQYDEPLNDVVIDVGEIDEWGVVSLLVSINGAGTDGAAVVPWSPPELL